MKSVLHYKLLLLCLLFITRSLSGSAQFYEKINWTSDGNGFYGNEEGTITEFSLTEKSKHILVSREKLTPAGQNQPLNMKAFYFSSDYKKLLIYTNAKKVW